MGKDNNIGIIVILAIIAISAFGGAKNFKNNAIPVTQEQKQVALEQKISETKTQVEELKKQIQIEEDKKIQSKYYGLVKLQYVNRSDKSESEYISLHVDESVKEGFVITGWKLKSLSTGSVGSIPSGTQLFFTGMVNPDQPIIVYPGDNLYIVTGMSPNGSSFRINKCSGYLSQFQTFIPYISTSCPHPSEEDLSSIPPLVINDACLEYITNYFPYCRIQTDVLPKNWSYECTKFIYDKINYPSCINTHRNDKDFYQKEWRIYLKRSDTLWKSSRENIVLYDNEDKIVDSLKY